MVSLILFQGSRSVIGIYIELGKELKVSDRAFERMSSVQFLNLSCDFSHPSPYVLESLICLPRELKVLDWTEFPMTCLPSNFNPEFLVGINMSFSKLEKLWEGNKVSTNISLSKNLYTSVLIEPISYLLVQCALAEKKLNDPFV